MTETYSKSGLDLLDFYEDDLYPDIIQEDYSWAERDIKGAASILSNPRPGTVWRDVDFVDVPVLIGEAVQKMKDIDFTIRFKVSLSAETKKATLEIVTVGFDLIVMHAAGSPNLPWVLEFYADREPELEMLISKDGLFWFHHL